MVLFEMQRHLARLRADPSLGGGSDSSREEAGELFPGSFEWIQLTLLAMNHRSVISRSHMSDSGALEAIAGSVPLFCRHVEGIRTRAKGTYWDLCEESSARHTSGRCRNLRGLWDCIWSKRRAWDCVSFTAHSETPGIFKLIGFGRMHSADTFWHKSIHCSSSPLNMNVHCIDLVSFSDAIYASIANLVILFLFVWEMEATRTPSGLAKISFWSIVLMVGADAWLFSAVSWTIRLSIIIITQF